VWSFFIGETKCPTAHYITDMLAGCDISVSRLAHGVPVGGELDYLDEGTLAAAMKSRRPF
jgi:recombination protein RecR